MQANLKYQNLTKGQPQRLTHNELVQLQTYCLQQSILPEYLIKIATTLYKKNKEQSYHFLQSMADNALPQKYTDPFYNKQKIRLYNCLTAQLLAKAARTNQVELSHYWLIIARKYIVIAEAIEEVSDYQTLLNRAMTLFYEGDIPKAITLAQNCEEAMQHQPNNRLLMTNAYIMLAQFYFAKRSYEKSLDYYKKCLLFNKCLSVKARLGMAYCLFYLNRFQVSKACFQRILQLQPRCSAAYLGLGIIYERNQQFNLYLQCLKAAFRMNKKQPLTLYLIAEHYLVKNELQKCQEYCRQGQNNLKSFSKIIKNKSSFRCDYYQFYRRFINLQGQIQHKKKNFPAAIEYYSQAAQKQLLWNDISLMQCLIYTKNYQQALERMEYIYFIYDRDKKDSRYLKDSYRLMAYLKRKLGLAKDEIKNSVYYYNEAIKYDKSDLDLKWEFSYHLTRSDPHRSLRIMQQIQKLSLANNKVLLPEMQINMGVLAILNHQPQIGQHKLKKAIEAITIWDDLDQIQQKGFLIIARYNYAFCLEQLNFKYASLEIYQAIIRDNRFHLQSFLRKAYVLHKIGDYGESLNTLALAQKICRSQSKTEHLVEDIDAMKAYLLYLQGRCDQSLYIIGLLIQGKPQNIYYKVLGFSVRYSMTVRSKINNEKLLQLFVEGKEYCQSICEKDANALFCFMMLTTIQASIKQLTKQQGMMAFKSISINANQLPSIRYNTGLYYMYQNDEQAAISCFNQYRDYTQTSQANQLISYLYLINKDYKRSIKQIKRNILSDPSNIKYRAQLVYATQARCQEDYNSTNSKIWAIASQEIKKCFKFHHYFQETELNKFYSGSCQKKQGILLNLRAVSQQKIISAQVLIDKFEKRKLQQNPKGSKLPNTESDESEGEEDRIERENKKKKQLLLQRVKVSKDKINQAWELINQKKNKALQAEKIKRKPYQSKEVQKLSAPTKKHGPRKEEAVKRQAEEYYQVKKQKKEKQSLKKEVVKEQTKLEDEQNLKNYLL